MRHDLDPWSLLFGLVFAGVAIAGLTGGLARLWSDPNLWSPQTLVPTALILLGVLLGGFASAMLRRRRTDGSTNPSDEVREDASTAA